MRILVVEDEATGAAFVLGRRSLTDIPTIVICAITMFVLFKLKKVPEPIVIAIAGLVGLVLKTAA